MGQLSPLVQQVINGTDLRLRAPSAVERDAILLGVLRGIREDQQVVGSSSRTEVWNRGWGENLADFKQGGSKTALVPKFMRSNQPIRWQKSFYFPLDLHFEQNYAEILRAYVFDYFKSEGIREIHEFGAGTGWNLLRAWELLETDPDIRFVGSDFVPSSVELIRHVAVECKAPIESRLFDMRRPDESYSFANPLLSGVFTFGSLEQLAGDLSSMLDFLVEKKPAIVISIEPASETYDLESLEDFTAFWFQTQRGYSSRLIERLKNLEDKELIRIERIKRLGFGSVMMEGYNLFIWRVL